MKILVAGAGGFIGHHLVSYLKARGYWVRGVDIKEPEFAPSAADEFLRRDLRNINNAREAVEGCGEVYQLAANMGGMGFISHDEGTILHDNMQINLNMVAAACHIHSGVKRYLFTSSACIYPEHLQLTPDINGLKESDAWPADPDTLYGLEKLTTERLCLAFARDDFQVRIARFHNIYGPLGTWQGGREKAPAALCRKVAEQAMQGVRGADDGVTIPVWGDGLQTRSFLYIDDCLNGLYTLMQSGYAEPLNIGSDRMVSINELADIIGQAAGVTVAKNHDLTKPQGVRGRNSDNTLSREVLGWEPQISLEDGIARTYAWIAGQVWKQAREGTR